MPDIVKFLKKALIRYLYIYGAVALSYCYIKADSTIFIALTGWLLIGMGLILED